VAALRIAHISDLHVLHLGGVRARDFLNKRLTGAATLLLARSKAHQESVVEAAVRDLQEQSPDHVVVTGDLTNLSLPSEFAAVTDMLRPLGGRDRVSVVPGNHDVYTRGSRGLFDEACAEWLPVDHAERGFPWVKRLNDDVTLIGLCSAEPTPWLMANGRVGDDQLERLRELLATEVAEGRFVIVMLHHPLSNDPPHRLYWMRNLRDAEGLVAVLKEGGASMVLHGHNHIRHSNDAAGIPVHTAASTSNVGPGDSRSRAWSRYVIWEVDAQARVAEPASVREYDVERGAFVAATT